MHSPTACHHGVSRGFLHVMYLARYAWISPTEPDERDFKEAFLATYWPTSLSLMFHRLPDTARRERGL